MYIHTARHSTRSQFGRVQCPSSSEILQTARCGWHLKRGSPNGGAGGAAALMQGPVVKLSQLGLPEEVIDAALSSKSS